MAGPWPGSAALVNITKRGSLCCLHVGRACVPPPDMRQRKQAHITMQVAKMQRAMPASLGSYIFSKVVCVESHAFFGCCHENDQHGMHLQEHRTNCLSGNAP
jgi:hypothetical protein